MMLMLLFKKEWMILINISFSRSLYQKFKWLKQWLLYKSKFLKIIIGLEIVLFSKTILNRDMQDIDFYIQYDT